MEDIKLATPEQVERIRLESDFSAQSAVLAMGEDLAVVKQVTELDPIFFAPDTGNSRKALFVWGIQNWMRLNGVPAYYFSVNAEDEKWQKVVTTFGAERVSKIPEIRFVKVL